MPPKKRLTKAQKQAALKVLTASLFEDDDEYIYKILIHNRFNGADDIVQTTEERLETLKDEKGEDIAPNSFGLLRSFRNYTHHAVANGETADHTFYQNIDPDTFDIFCTGPHNTTSTELQAAAATTRATTSRTSDAVRDFQRGIKRDPSVFPTFKDDGKWDHFNRKLEAQCQSQGVANVLDSSYVPHTDEAKQLFQLQQEYVYAIFVDKLQTDTSQEIVRMYQDQSDAQKIYAALVDNYTKQTQAKLDSKSLFQYLSTSKVDEWKGPTHSYIVHWLEQVRLFHTIAPGKIGDEQLRVLLQTAVESIEFLANVGIQAEINDVRDGNITTWDQYQRLLKAAAKQYDKKHGSKTRTREHCHVYLHDLEGDADDEPIPDESPPDTAFDIDTNLYEVMQAQRRTPQLGRHKWFKLGDQDKSLWDQLTDSGKRVILGMNSAGSPSPAHSPAHSTPPLVPPRRPPQRVNAAELSSDARHYLEIALHAFRAGRDCNNSVAEPATSLPEAPPPTDDIDQLYAYVTQKRNTTTPDTKVPGDITRLLSKASAKKE